MWQGENFKQKEGFTLIELIVAMGLFAVVVAIAVGGFANAFRSQRQAAALIETNSNVSLSIEQMMREMRMGYDFCDAAGETPCNSDEEISFRSARGETVKYCLTENTIVRMAKNKGMGSILGCDKESSITSLRVQVKSLKFLVSGAVKPLVTISLSVSPTDADLKNNEINIQTSVSPRTPNS